jgi:hypothetical protein
MQAIRSSETSVLTRAMQRKQPRILWIGHWIYWLRNYIRNRNYPRALSTT